MEFNEMISKLENPTILDLSNGDAYIIGGTLDKIPSKSLFFFEASTGLIYKRKDLDFEIFNFSIVKFDSFLYIIGGRLSTGAYFKQIYRYDIYNDVWESIPDVEGLSRVNAKSIVYDNKIYIFGGVDGILENSELVKVFDPLNLEWVNLSEDIIIPFSNTYKLTVSISDSDIIMYSEDQIFNKVIKKVYNYTPHNNSWKIYRNVIL